MQITETSSEGLKRTLQVVVPAGELGKRFDSRLDEIKDRVQLKGFRKGKVPVPHLKKMYGRSLMVEVLQETVRDTSNQALADRNLRPAMQPNVTLPEDNAEIERVLSGESDLSYSMSFEVLPAIELADFSKLELERLVAEVDDTAISEALDQLVQPAKRHRGIDGAVLLGGQQVLSRREHVLEPRADGIADHHEVPIDWYLVRQGGSYSDSGALVCSVRCLRQWVKAKAEEPMKTGTATSPSGRTEA